MFGVLDQYTGFLGRLISASQTLLRIFGKNRWHVKDLRSFISTLNRFPGKWKGEGKEDALPSMRSHGWWDPHVLNHNNSLIAYSVPTVCKEDECCCARLFWSVCHLH